MDERLVALELSRDEDYFLTANHLRVYARRWGHDYAFNPRSITAINICRIPFQWAEYCSGFAALGAMTAVVLFLSHEVSWLHILYAAVAIILAVISVTFFFGPFHDRIEMYIIMPRSVENNTTNTQLTTHYPQYLVLGWYRRKRYTALTKFAAQVNKQLKALREDIVREKQAGAEFRSYDWLRATLQDGLTKLLGMLPKGQEDKVPVSRWDGVRYKPAFKEEQSLSILQVCTFMVNQLFDDHSPEEIQALMANGGIAAIMTGDIGYLKFLIGLTKEKTPWVRHWG